MPMPGQSGKSINNPGHEWEAAWLQAKVIIHSTDKPVDSNQDAFPLAFSIV
jgi:hypothetical protein